MKLTSKQKKIWLPLSVMLLSLILYVTLLGSGFAIIAGLVFSASAAAFLGWNGDRLLTEFNDWANSDDIA